MIGSVSSETSLNEVWSVECTTDQMSPVANNNLRITERTQFMDAVKQYTAKSFVD